MIFEPDQDGKADNQTGQERAELSVTLYWQQACAVSGAVLEWLSYIESDIEDYRVPALHMELASLTFDFHRQSVEQGLRMMYTVDTEGGLFRQVSLTRSEASLLGWVRFCLSDEEADQQNQELS